MTRKRIALVRGPNLNSWEMQNFSPLKDNYDFVGFTSRRHNFDISQIPFEVKKLWSWGQFLTPRLLRKGFYRFLGDYHDLQGLGRALRGFDLVHSAESYYYCSYQAAREKQRLRYKLVVTVWENIPFLFNLPSARRVKERVFEETNLFLAITERAKQALILEGAPPDKIQVQMPGIDLRFFRPMAKDESLLHEFNCSKDDIILLFAAHLYVQKGIYDLLYAFTDVLQQSRTKNIKLLIAGRGPEEAKVKSLVSQLHLQGNVRLIGSHPYSRMPSVHNLADVFVLPSQPAREWQEQFGYVLVESMACGKPVISTTSGSIPEVVCDAGLLVPPSDFIALGKALLTLVGDQKHREALGAEARVRVTSLFDTQKVAQQIKAHYESVLND